MGNWVSGRCVAKGLFVRRFLGSGDFFALVGPTLVRVFGGSVLEGIGPRLVRLRLVHSRPRSDGPPDPYGLGGLDR